MADEDADWCSFTWPLEDPNEEDVAYGRTHRCRLRAAHSGGHGCGCGARHV